MAPGVRRAERRDEDRLVALWSARVAHHAAIDAAFGLRGGSGAELARAVAAELRDPDAAVLVWERDADLSGFVVARLRRAPGRLAEPARAQIEELFVREDARRRGIGRALVAGAFDGLRERGAARVEVRVAAGNAEGQAFWRALGFGRFVDVLQRRL